MSTTIDAIPLTYERAQSDAEAIWPVYAVLFASISIVTGLIWDISWHRSIGRDSFWSPPHVLEQIAAIADVPVEFVLNFQKQREQKSNGNRNGKKN